MTDQTNEDLKGLLSQIKSKLDSGSGSAVDKEQLERMATEAASKAAQQGKAEATEFEPYSKDEISTKAGEFAAEGVTGYKSFVAYDGESKAIKRLQAQHDDLVFVNELMNRGHRGYEGVQSLRGYKAWSDSLAALKVLVSTTGGSGDEWVPTDLSSQLWERIQLESKVAGLFGTLNTSSEPFEMPVQTETGEYARVIAENTATTAETSPTTAKVQFATKRFVAYSDITDLMEEDSAVAILPYIKGYLSKTMARARERMIMNGDGNATHMDTDIEGVSTTDPADSGIYGLRATAMDQSSTNTAASNNFTFAEAIETRKAMSGAYAANSGDLVWISSVAGWLNAMTNLTEMKTLDVMGPQATLLTGQISNLMGSPWILSEEMPDTLNATGINGASGNTKTGILLVHRPSWTNVVRRVPALEEDKAIKSGVRTLVLSARFGFGTYIKDQPFTGSDPKSVGFAIDVAP